MSWTCFLVFFMLGFFPAQSQDSSECPENYVKIHRSCYKFVIDGDSAAEWAESPDGCDGNNLVLVQSVAEMQKLEEYMNKNKFAAGKYWVGIRKDTTKGDKPKWLDNSDVAQPIMKPNRRRYDCSAINLQPNQFQLVLHYCDDTLPYICEYTQISERSAITVTTFSTEETVVGSATPPPQVEPEPSVEGQPCVTSNLDPNLLAKRLLNTDDTLYKEYLQSEIKANLAKVAYYDKVARLYEASLTLNNQYLARSQAKVEIEIDQLKQRGNCNN